MTQTQLVLAYVKQHKGITPAKMAGRPYKGNFFGSETPKRCRELRQIKLLNSIREGRFEFFFPSKKLLKMFEK